MGNAAEQTPSRELDSRFLATLSLLERGVDEAAYPGAVFLLGTGDDVAFLEAVGRRAVEGPETITQRPQMETRTVFDLGGLTAAVGTSLALMRLVTDGLVKLDDRVVRYLQGFSTLGKGEVTVRHLLNHTSGLPGYNSFQLEVEKTHGPLKEGTLSGKGIRDLVLHTIQRSSVRFKPGTKQLRSDLGLMMAGFVIEAVTGTSLENSLKKLVFGPLNLRSTSFIDLDRVRRKDYMPAVSAIAATDYCATRKRMLCGEASDENCWIMGGIAGHSGLFSSAVDLFILCRELRLASKGASSMVSAETLQDFWAVPQGIPDPCWCCGWEVPHRKNGMQGTLLSKDARGGYGFTGCALWIEPKDDLTAVFLSNRIHPSRNNRAIGTLLPQLFQRALEAVAAGR